MASTTSAWGRGFKVSLYLVALMVIVTLAVWGLNAQSAASQSEPSASATAQPSAIPTGTGTPAPTCDKKFVQVAGSHGNDGKVDATFEAAIAKATASTSGTTQEKAINAVLLQHTANNAQRLAIWANSLGLWPNPNDYSKLVKDNCLSSEGQALFYKLDGALSASGVSTTIADAPANGHNSGVIDNKFVVAERPGIINPLKSVKITFKDGSTAYILIYCGNVIFPAPPTNIPTSPKVPQPEKPVAPQPEQPKQPEQPFVPPAPVCPPGTTGTPPNCPEWKLPAQDPAQNGNAGNGGGQNADPGPGAYVPPAQMVRPPDAPRVNPPAPVAPKPAAPPKVTPPAPVPGPAKPLPTVEPAKQPPNHGVVEPNPVKGEPCNPDFQSCG